MKQTVTLGFVWGYLPEIDVRSSAAIKAGLLQRFSVALAYYPDGVLSCCEIRFNSDLVIGVLSSLLQLFPHDTLVATDSEGKEHALLNDACQYDAENDDWKPIETIRLSAGETTVCYVEHEAYQLVGGPNPYHDAYVYAFYCRDMERNVVQKALFEHAIENDLTVLEVCSGAPEPVASSRLRKFLNWIRW